MYVIDQGAVPVKFIPSERAVFNPHNEVLPEKAAVGTVLTVNKAVFVVLLPHELVKTSRNKYPV